MTDDELKEYAFEKLTKWKQLIADRELKKAQEEAKLVIVQCKNILKDVPLGTNPKVRDDALIIGILFRGLQDFAEIPEIVIGKDLANEHELIENAWQKMCDSKERIEYAYQFCKPIDIVDWALSHINNLENIFNETFGQGLYTSPEILAQVEICGICGKDIRSCEHVAGMIYDGVHCVSLPQGLHSDGIAFVQNPADPRCKIWPWQIEQGGNIIHCTILTTFRLDDFMNDEIKDK
jgi:hypothetical protein